MVSQRRRAGFIFLEGGARPSLCALRGAVSVEGAQDGRHFKGTL